MLRFEPRVRNEIDRSVLDSYPDWLATLLLIRGIKTQDQAERFLNPSLCDLHDPFLMQDMDKAVALIESALARQLSIVVYGDYDVDGICASSIMTEYLRERGGNVTFRIPDRHEEGYGLHENAIREIAASAALLITVDCGITNHAEVELARSLGLKVIVTDHHQPADTLPSADAVLDPLLGDYPFRRLCGAGVALKVCQALGGMSAILPRVDLAALATVADVVSLVDENRVIVREGLNMMSCSSRPGLKALIEVSGLKTPLNAGNIAFQLAPRLNSGGRLENATQCVRLMLTRDPEEALALASHLDDVNKDRRQMEETMLHEADRMLPESVDFRTDRVLILAGPNWEKGVIGLVAGKLCERFHYPVIVLSVMGDEATGSCRSIPGVNIHAMLTSCKDLFTRFGGHEQAAGLTIPTERIPELRRRLNLAIREQCDPTCFIPVQEYDLPLDLEDSSLETVRMLENLQPFGYGNPAPLFLAGDCDIQSASRIGKDRSHLRMEILQKDSLRKCVGFSMGYVADSGWTGVDVVYSPERNEFNGNVSLQLMLKAVRPSSASTAIPDEHAVFAALMQELSLLATNEKASCSDLPVASRTALISALRKVHGTLVLTHSRRRAFDLSSESGADIAFRKNNDPRGFSQILCGPDLNELGDLWDEIILADGDLLPGEVEVLRARCPHASLSRMQDAPEVLDLLRSLDMERETLGNIYKVVRSERLPLENIARSAEVKQEQVLMALHVFKDIGLVSWTDDPSMYSPIPPKGKLDLNNSPLIRWFRDSFRTR